MKDGAYVEGGRGGVLAQVGEAKESEIVFPFDTGVKMLAKELSNVKGNQQAINNSSITHETHTHIHVGIDHYYGDESSLKRLENRLSRIRIGEAQRVGAYT